jgi:hypothetical protein
VTKNGASCGDFILLWALDTFKHYRPQWIHNSPSGFVDGLNTIWPSCCSPPAPHTSSPPPGFPYLLLILKFGTHFSKFFLPWIWTTECIFWSFRGIWTRKTSENTFRSLFLVEHISSLVSTFNHDQFKLSIIIVKLLKMIKI